MFFFLELILICDIYNLHLNTVPLLCLLFPLWFTQMRIEPWWVSATGKGAGQNESQDLVHTSSAGSLMGSLISVHFFWGHSEYLLHTFYIPNTAADMLGLTKSTPFDSNVDTQYF